MEIKNITDAASELETGEIRIGEALSLLCLILDDMDEPDGRTEEGRLILSLRCEKYLNSLFILSRDLERLKDDLHDAAAACYAAGRRDRETVERVKLSAARYEIAELASGKDGVDICAILKGMGYTKLSDAAPEELDAILDRVRQEAQKVREAQEAQDA